MATIQDDNGYLILSHYDHCDNTSDSLLKSQRGTITDINGKLVCQSFGYTHEYSPKDEEWKGLVENSLQNCHIFLAEEGSLLRLFCYENRWHLSTHKRIDAFSSHWGSSNSFGDLFIDALEYFYTNGQGKGLLDYAEKEHLFDVFCAQLSMDTVYTFLLRTNSDTKIVCDPPTSPTLYFAGQFYKGMRLEGNPTHLPWPTKVMFSQPADLADYVEKLDPHQYAGVIVMTNDQQVFKIVNPSYSELAKLRGCEPSIYRAYLRVRENEDDLKKFIEMFKEKKTLMTSIENDILVLARKICQYYMRRFVHKEHIVVDKNYYYIMRLAHEWHCANREQNILTVDKFLEILDNQEPNFLYKLLHI